jgi:hypothetical protein
VGSGLVLQNCAGITVVNGGGTIANAAITGVAVTCTTLTARFLFTANTSQGSASTPPRISAYAINAGTGALTLINTVAAGDMPRFPELVGLQ